LKKNRAKKQKFECKRKRKKNEEKKSAKLYSLS